VRTHLTQGYSPEQITGRLRRAYPDDMSKQLSAETIYAGLYMLPCGTQRSALLATLRQARKAPRPRARGTDRRGQISQHDADGRASRRDRDPHGARPLGR